MVNNIKCNEYFTYIEKLEINHNKNKSAPLDTHDIKEYSVRSTSKLLSSSKHAFLVFVVQNQSIFLAKQLRL